MPDEEKSEAWTILLVDDEEDILESLKEFLEMRVKGLTVRTAGSGPEALESLKKDPVDLIISDYKMPEMDGIEFLRLANDIVPGIPRIILTAFPKLELAVTAINEVEVDRFLTKPIQPEALEHEVMTLLRRHDLQESHEHQFTQTLSSHKPEPTDA